ncbi:hypothetical protein GOC19_14520 [Sinorhizobium meliloti]|nr:hypothetical protein [Sinorhizobium meliloti]
MVREDILQRFGLLAFRLKRTNYLFGDTFGVADRYPFRSCPREWCRWRLGRRVLRHGPG